MIKRLSALAVAGFMSLPVQAQDGSTVVAVVNGLEITVGHMIVARATLPQQYQQLPDEILFQGILDQLIQQSALAQSYSGELPPRVLLSIENETRSLTAAEVVEEVMADAVSEEALNALYQEEYGDSAPGSEYNASHILVETEEAAKEIVEELEAGADFAALARQKSTGPSGPSGGSLGWFGPGMMVAPFEQAVMALEAGEVSAPVETQFGWHVITLNDTRLKDVPQLDEVRAELEQKVRENAVQARIDALLETAEVDRSMSENIDASILRDMTLIE